MKMTLLEKTQNIIEDVNRKSSNKALIGNCITFAAAFVAYVVLSLFDVQAPVGTAGEVMNLIFFAVLFYLFYCQDRDRRNMLKYKQMTLDLVKTWEESGKKSKPKRKTVAKKKTQPKTKRN